VPVVKATARTFCERCGRSNLYWLASASGAPEKALGRRPGFTLIDLMVSIVVMAVLISLLLPSLTVVRESTRRVVCSSNIRQHGLALAMYGEDYRSLPITDFDPGLAGKEPGTAGTSTSTAIPQSQNAMLARVGGETPQWDGLGMLYAGQYLDNFGVFYCPSHTGEHSVRTYAAAWHAGDSGTQDIFINYQYRGSSATAFPSTDTARVAVLTDGMRTQADFNHVVGTNVLRADVAVSWFSDSARVLLNSLPLSTSDVSSAIKVQSAWQSLDDRR
jgi:type II secretory pathway pseudopilin PulG